MVRAQHKENWHNCDGRRDILVVAHGHSIRYAEVTKKKKKKKKCEEGKTQQTKQPVSRDKRENSRSEENYTRAIFSLLQPQNVLLTSVTN
jgi:hypothetical protein